MQQDHEKKESSTSSSSLQPCVFQCYGYRFSVVFRHICPRPARSASLLFQPPIRNSLWGFLLCSFLPATRSIFDEGIC